MPGEKTVLMFSSPMTMRDAVRIKVRHLGARKPIKEIFVGADRHCAANRWVEKERIIDRASDLYIEIVKEEGTGRIIHECREPLSRHRNHGSAKKNRACD